MNEIKLEVGKTYRSREGKEVRITEKYDTPPFPYYSDDGNYYAEDGSFWYKENPNDLIEEVLKTRHTFKILIMEWIKIFKRGKTKQTIPEPKFEDTWMEDKYQQHVKEGVLALHNGKSVKIFDDGRGYELACDIKRQFILEYQKQLAEKIKITGGSEITVYFSNVL